MQHAKNPWLVQIKDAYYKIDDVLDEWNTKRIKSQIQKEEEEGDKINAPAALKKTKKKVFSFLPSPSCSCCFRPANNLALRHDIGHKIKRLNETLDRIGKCRELSGFDVTRQPEDVVERPKTTSYDFDVSDIFGRDSHKADVLSNLLSEGSSEERNHRVISLVGMGGVGKSTLAQLVYNDPAVKAHFEKRMWVCVSEPFDQCRVAKAIINEVDPEKQITNDSELQSLLNRICGVIKDKKFFLVFDDVWTEDSRKWEPFGNALKYGAQGSRILVTTRNNKVAEMMGSFRMIDLEVLSDDDCWSMFRKIAFSNDEDQCKDLEDLGKQLAKKCIGLPLAAKTLGGLMRNKRCRREWKDILDSSLWESKVFEKRMSAPLLLSYYDLPSAVRRCFSYCATFPKDHRFDKDELVLLWMAQGYIDSKTDMEMKAEEYFEDLAMRSLFQDFKKGWNDGRILRCQMHDIVHDFAQLMAKNECFSVDGDEEFRIDSKSARHLSLIIKKTFPVKVDGATNLRSLYMEFSNVLPNLFQDLTCLRTLSLRGKSFMTRHSINKLPDEVGKLIHLRFLKLCNIDIAELPETICNLCNLQTLNFTDCYELTKLPKGMGKLINLRHLIIIDNVSSIKSYSRGIGRLTSLRTLSRIRVGNKDDAEGFKIGDLKNLYNLRGDIFISGLENVVDVRDAENAQLKKKIHLDYLTLLFGDDKDEGNRRMKNDVLVLNALEPHPDLENLSIRMYQGLSIPNWIMSLTKLKTLELSCCKLESLPPLGKLPSLESLYINGVKSLKKVGVKFLGIESKNKKDDDNNLIFPKLKYLSFWGLPEWEEWNGIGGMREEEEEEDNGVTLIIMPCLQELRIARCPNLKWLPDFLRTTTLKELEISDSPILSERMKIEEWPKSHIPNIKIDVKYVQRDDKECESNS